MAITPRRATVTAETTTEFVVEVPLIVQGVNVKTKLDELSNVTPLSNRITTTQENLTSANNTITAVSSSLVVVSSSLVVVSSSIPRPGGDAGFLQFKLNGTEFSGSSTLYFNKDFDSLTHGNNINSAIGSYCHGEGWEVTASGGGCHAEGYRTTTAVSSFYSHAEGHTTRVAGEGSHAEGQYTTSSANYAHAEGIYSNINVSGIGGHAEGYGTWLNGTGSHCEGKYTTTLSSGKYAHTEGYYTTGSAFYSHAEGEHTLTLGRSSHAEGYYAKTTSTGLYAHVEGAFTTGSTEGCHVEGYGCYTEDLGTTEHYGLYAHAEGYQSHAGGDYSHAEGYQTVASGAYSHAEGRETVARSFGSHASGYQTVARGEYSFAAGIGTNAYGSGLTVPQFACGKYNTTNNTTSLFVVGNGTSTSTRSDLLKVDSDNSIRFNGTAHFNNTAYIAKGLNLNLKEVVPPQTYYVVTEDDYCIIAYSDMAVPYATFISLPNLGVLPVGRTLIIKNSWSSPQNAFLSISQSTGAQYIDATIGPVTLAPGTGYQIVLMRAGYWQIIGRF
jgi:hypothetical protein